MKTILFFFNLFFSILIAGSNPEPPAIPTLQAMSGYEHVLLYWDKAAEKCLLAYESIIES